jgi:hypothetical protein
MNESLAAFALKPPAFDVVTTYTPDFADPAACDPSEFLPFSPIRFEPYRSRTRLFRTLNDVFLAINQRQPQYLDQGPSGLLDLPGRTTDGAGTRNYSQRDDARTLSKPRVRTVTPTKVDLGIVI